MTCASLRNATVWNLHPEILTYPHYGHDGAEVNVLPHGPIGAEEVLAIIATEGLMGSGGAEMAARVFTAVLHKEEDIYVAEVPKLAQ